MKIQKSIMVAWNVVGVLIFGYLIFFGPRYINESPIFNSPDEAVNYWASKKILNNEKPLIYIPVNLQAYKYLDSRSTFYFQPSVIAPSGFVGFPIISGYMAKLFNTESAILWVTPFAVIILAWGLFFASREFFGNRAALVSYFIFILFSPVVYYSMRGMFNNLLFSVFWFLGMCLLYLGAQKEKKEMIIYSALAWVLIILSMFIRPSEILWIIAGLVAFFFVARHSYKPYVGFIFILASFLVVPLYIFIHSIILGSAPALGSIGYTSGTDFLFVSLKNIYQIILPFGFNIKNIAVNIYQVFLINLWWVTIPTVLGIGVLIKKHKELRNIDKAFIFSFGVSAIYLLIMYGSWKTFDTAGDNIMYTIGNAHFRYWLPIFLILPFISVWFVQYLSQRLHKSLGSVLRITYVVVFIIFSYNLTFNGIDGILATGTNLNVGKNILSILEKNISEKDIVITNTDDKFLFGKFNVSRRLDIDSIKNILSIGNSAFGVYSKTDSAFEKFKKEVGIGGFKLEELYDFEGKYIYKIIR